MLVGASRKRYLSRLFDEAEGEPRPFTENDAATVAITALSAAGGRLVRPGPPGPGQRGRGPGRRRLPGAARVMTRRVVVLALGSNLGDRRDILQGAVDAIAGCPGCG